MLEAYGEWPLAGGRRLWTQLMPGAYTDDGSAGAAALDQFLGSHACLGILISLSDQVGCVGRVLLGYGRMRWVSTIIISSSEIAHLS